MLDNLFYFFTKKTCKFWLLFKITGSIKLQNKFWVHEFFATSGISCHKGPFTQSNYLYAIVIFIIVIVMMTGTEKDYISFVNCKI